MKKLYTILVALLITASTFAQAPEKMSYQAVVRDSGDNLITSQLVGMQISILQTSATGTAVYVETQMPTTNINGLVTLEIGNGTVVSGDFTTIDWSADSYFIKTESDPTGATSYTITGTSQLLSVPYALHAKIAENVMNDLVDDADSDPTNEIELPQSAGNNDFLVWNGTVWVAKDLGGVSLATLPNAPTSYATAGNIQFRYNSTSTGGYIEARTISGYQNTMVFATKKYSTWSPGGSGTVENYHNNTGLSTTWAPVMTLWDGAAWDGRVTLSSYEMFEGTMWDMGTGSSAPAPTCWKFYTAIDGYNQVFISAVYQGE